MLVCCLSVSSKVETWRHCHSPSLAPVKSRLGLPFCYRLTRSVLDKERWNGCWFLFSSVWYSLKPRFSEVVVILLLFPPCYVMWWLGNIKEHSVHITHLISSHQTSFHPHWVHCDWSQPQRNWSCALWSDIVHHGCDQSQQTQFRWNEVRWDEIRWHGRSGINVP